MTDTEKLKILSENLALLEQRGNIGKNQINLTLRAIASTACAKHQLSVEEALAEFNSFLPNTAVTPKTSAVLCRELVQSREGIATACKYLTASGADGPRAGAHGRIAYVKNELNEMAFDALSAEVPHPKPTLLPTLSGCCESVYDGENEFCILPIQNGIDGRLLAFYSLIDRYELKIRSVRDIEDEHSGSIRYALLSKEWSGAWGRADAKRRPWLLEFSIVAEDAGFLQELLAAANELSAALQTFDFVPLQYDTGLKRYFLLFKLPYESALPLSLCMTLTYPSFTQIGFFAEPTQY